jgi:hypothetical protein
MIVQPKLNFNAAVSRTFCKSPHDFRLSSPGATKPYAATFVDGQLSTRRSVRLLDPLTDVDALDTPLAANLEGGQFPDGR